MNDRELAELIHDTVGNLLACVEKETRGFSNKDTMNFVLSVATHFSAMSLAYAGEKNIEAVKKTFIDTLVSVIPRYIEIGKENQYANYQ